MTDRARRRPSVIGLRASIDVSIFNVGAFTGDRHEGYAQAFIEICDTESDTADPAETHGQLC